MLMARDGGSMPVENKVTTIAEDRRGARRSCTLCRLARVQFRGDVGLWRVLNMSDEGMMFETRVELCPMDAVTISLSNSVTLGASVVWNDSERCGVRLNIPIDSAALLRSLAAEQQSSSFRPLRLPVDSSAIAIDETGMHPLIVKDVSINGMGVTHLDRLRRGMVTKVRFARGRERRGAVRWSDGQNAGLLLLDPFTPEELERATAI